MFTGKFLLVLAVLALVGQHEVKCTMMDEFMDLVGLSATLIDDAAAFDEGKEKNEPIESSIYAEAADGKNKEEKRNEEIKYGTYNELKEELNEAIESEMPGFRNETAAEVKRKGEIDEAIFSGTYQDNSADQFVGFERLQIRYGDASSGCYLFWKGGSGTTKNAEFRCNEDEGDTFWIRKRGDDYLIGYDNCPLYWKGGPPGTTSLNAEFRCGGNGDTFWIRKRGDKTWAIGYAHCPLYAHGSGGTKNAAFECGKPIKYGFWIIDESANRFEGYKNLQLGYGDVSNGCYLYWHRGSSKINAEFRCNKDKGDTFWIAESTRFNMYAIAYDRCALNSNHDSGSTKNAEFRCAKDANFRVELFWIRLRRDKKWAIGYGNCPLYVRGDSGDTKNAEFRCGQPIKDVFWFTDYSADRFVGDNLIQIRYGEESNGCYLYWHGGSGTTKDAEFRCGKAKGDKFYIKKHEDGYRIGYYNNVHCLLHWKGGPGNGAKNAEFRCGETGDKFWIRLRKDKYWSIGFDDCPMYARGGSRDLKNAEFRCQQPSSERFWITGAFASPPGCGKPVFPPKSVVGGVDAVRGSWPWHVLLIIDGDLKCGGALISEEWVVTAYHCVEYIERKTIKVRVGEHDRNKKEGSEIDISVKDVVSHSSYRRADINANIALLWLSQKVKFSSYVKPVCLPEKDIPAGSNCYNTGFGTIKSPDHSHTVLQQARLTIPTNTKCGTANYKHMYWKPRWTEICGGATSYTSCRGDPGSPLVCEVNGKWELHGVMSWGYWTWDPWTCRPSIGYNVFVRVTKFKSWIIESIS